MMLDRAVEGKRGVLKDIWTCSGRDVLYTECEILTLGTDTSWRRLSKFEAPPIKFSDSNRSSVSIDGAICFWQDGGTRFIIFNSQDESFQEIDHPPWASGEHSFWLSSIRGDCSLVQFRGRFTVASGVVGQKLLLWELEYKGQSLSYEWIKEVINVPYDFPVRRYSFLGNLPKGEMLLIGAGNNKSAIPVYSYDHIERKFEEFEIGKFPLSEALIRKVRINYCEENITPLSCSFPFQDGYSP